MVCVWRRGAHKRMHICTVFKHWKLKMENSNLIYAYEVKMAITVTIKQVMILDLKSVINYRIYGH